ncbi:D-amino acid oxidase-like protein [Paraphoma chrysanthemicola]|nr:D-amino acid oxidase-like protein [Paraphoma chrysanthemicola]
MAQEQCYNVAVVAKHMPGDHDIEYASPWAGANFMPMSTTSASHWERRTWPYLKRLATDVPEAGIHLQKSRLYRRTADLERLRSGGTSALNNVFAENPWYRDLVDDYRDLRADELPPGIASGCEFGSVCVNPALYLPWLVGQCRANGVTFHREALSHVLDIRSLGPGYKVDVIVNATGLSAAKLGGVMDKTMFPIRGQTVLVRNVAPQMICVSGTDDGDDHACYMMTRATGGGTILGGTMQNGNWESQPDLNIANRIMQRAVRIAPELTNSKGAEDLDIIRHGVGLRPGREAGVRLEKEKIEGTWVVHNYGHAGWGYQGSYGCAEEVVALVNETQVRAKL